MGYPARNDEIRGHQGQSHGQKGARRRKPNGSERPRVESEARSSASTSVKPRKIWRRLFDEARQRHANAARVGGATRGAGYGAPLQRNASAKGYVWFWPKIAARVNFKTSLAAYQLR